MRSRKVSLSIGFMVVILAIMACVINLGGPAYPTPAIPVTTKAVGDLQNALATAGAGAVGTNQTTIVLTEPEVTSYVAYVLQQQSQPMFTNPQVYLQDGQITVYGTAAKGYFTATAEIVLTASVDAQGQPMIALTSANFGPLPVPAGLRDFISSSVQQAYTGALGPAATGFRLESITVANGTMTVVGQTR